MQRDQIPRKKSKKENGSNDKCKEFTGYKKLQREYKETVRHHTSKNIINRQEDGHQPTQ